MPRLLHISASPRREQSESIGLANAFLGEVRVSHPDVEVREWDLWDGSLPAFGPQAAAGKMAIFAGLQPHGDQVAQWDAVTGTFDRFANADYYLFSVPMWNHGIPYILKQLIDVVSQPGLLFGFDPASGYTGLLTGKKAFVVYTSAVYGPGLPASFGSDFQQPYFADWLRWAGIEVVDEITFRPNLVTTDADNAREAARAQAVASARRLGTSRQTTDRKRTTPTGLIAREELRSGLNAEIRTGVDAVPASY